VYVSRRESAVDVEDAVVRPDDKGSLGGTPRFK
jgi:hypothetical protein